MALALVGCGQSDESKTAATPTNVPTETVGKASHGMDAPGMPPGATGDGTERMGTKGN